MDELDFSMESVIDSIAGELIAIEQLQELQEYIAANGVSKSIAISVESISEGAISKLCPIVSFTATDSQTNVDVALEGIGSSIYNFFATIIRKILDGISALFNGLKNLFRSNKVDTKKMEAVEKVAHKPDTTFKLNASDLTVLDYFCLECLPNIDTKSLPYKVEAFKLYIEATISIIAELRPICNGLLSGDTAVPDDVEQYVTGILIDKYPHPLIRDRQAGGIFSEMHEYAKTSTIFEVSTTGSKYSGPSLLNKMDDDTTYVMNILRARLMALQQAKGKKAIGLIPAPTPETVRSAVLSPSWDVLENIKLSVELTKMVDEMAKLASKASATGIPDVDLIRQVPKADQLLKVVQKCVTSAAAASAAADKVIRMFILTADSRYKIAELVSPLKA
jgi:hypothetical protein